MPLPVEIENHTVPHFKGTINAKVELEGLGCDSIFSFYQFRPNLGYLLHETRFFDSDTHAAVNCQNVNCSFTTLLHCRTYLLTKVHT